MKSISKSSAIIALDVGGTTIKGALVTAGGTFAGDVQEVPSSQEKDAVVILATLSSLIQDLHKNARTAHLSVEGVGLAMPAPFDYDKGISFMRHKFRALYGYNMKQALEKELRFSVHFVKDALAFALGVQNGEKRLLAVTLGTGLGSGFLVDGRLATEEEGAPKDGEIWNMPYRAGILEDFVSRRAVERSYQQGGGDAHCDVREIAEKVRSGDVAAIRAFTAMAAALGEGLAGLVVAFNPTRIVFGGQISKAHDLFLKRAESACAQHTGLVTPFTATSNEYAALVGVAHVARNSQ